MKTIIAGSRTVTSLEVVRKAVHLAGVQIAEVVSGRASGVDRLGEEWARENSIPVAEFPADWKHYGKRTGYLRNRQMGEYAEALIAVWDGKSRGTGHMIDIAYELGLVVKAFVFNERTGELKRYSRDNDGQTDIDQKTEGGNEMGRTLALVAALAVFAVMAMGTGSMVQAQNKGTYVVKPTTESPARTSCVAKCRSAAMKNKVYCDKEKDPVEKAYCMKRLDAPYNYCVSKCPAK